MSHLENTTPLPQKQPQEIEQWLLNVLDATTTGGKVEPRQVILENTKGMLGALRWQGFKKLCKQEHVMDPRFMETIATSYPNLAELLRTKDSIQAILNYRKQHPAEIARFHKMMANGNDLALSVEMGQISDKEEIWTRCWNIIRGDVEEDKNAE